MVLQRGCSWTCHNSCYSQKAHKKYMTKAHANFGGCRISPIQVLFLIVSVVLLWSTGGRCTSKTHDQQENVNSECEHSNHNGSSAPPFGSMRWLLSSCIILNGPLVVNLHVLVPIKDYAHDREQKRRLSINLSCITVIAKQNSEVQNGQ